MKTSKLLFSLLATLCISANCHAQSMVTFSFTFQWDGAPAVADSIYIRNLSRNWDTTLYGSTMTLTLPNITSLDEGIESGTQISNFSPNPTEDFSKINLSLSRAQNVDVTICNISGRVLNHSSKHIEAGNHQIIISPGRENIYLIHIETEEDFRTLRLIQLGEARVNNPMIEFQEGIGDVTMRTSEKGVYSWVAGNQMLFIGYATNINGDPGSQAFLDNPSSSQSYTFNLQLGMPCKGVPVLTDFNGNYYQSVLIGSQCWMKENLKVRNYNDGTPIPLIPNQLAWTSVTTGARGWYNYDSASYAGVYGALYNYPAVSSNKLCPLGWHVPTDIEFQRLELYLGMTPDDAIGGQPRGTNEGDMLKEAGNTHWAPYSSIHPNNESGFTALPGGYRIYGNGVDIGLGQSGNYWSSYDRWARVLSYNAKTINRGKFNINDGLSVRCVKDSTQHTLLPASLTTDSVIVLTSFYARSGGNIISDGGAPVVKRGICWSESNPPYLSNRLTSNETGIGTYSSLLSGLVPSTTYYVRAYAITSIDTVFGNVQTFTTPSHQFQVFDIEGNGYDTIAIGTQVWLKQNLRTRKYNDGVLIPLVNGQYQWSQLSSGARCWVNNDSSQYASTYGSLYNWYAVNTGKLCPIGWHVPSRTEWTTLVNFLGGDAAAASKLKDTLLWTPSTSIVATNTSGFSALPSGFVRSDGYYESLSLRSSFWSSTSVSSNAYFRYLAWNLIYANEANNSQKYGLSVRCIRD